jgi:DNA-binding NarL/FixJ family response regulator
VITERHPDTSVVMLSMRRADRELALALRNGASEYLDKGMPAGEILAAVKRQEATV